MRATKALISCELLSEFSTFGISNNVTLILLIYNTVVNCFQNLVPLVSATTLLDFIHYQEQL